jgi:hypothetical protein
MLSFRQVWQVPRTRWHDRPMPDGAQDHLT